MSRGLLPAQIADVRTAVMGSVCIHDFAVETGLWDAETIAFADDRRGVHNGDDKVFGVFSTTNKGKNAVIGIVCVYPFESMPVKFNLVKSGFGGVKAVEIADQTLDTAM